MTLCRTAPAAAALCALLLSSIGPRAVARADVFGRIAFVEENDGLLPDARDRHYTQGAMISVLSPTVRPEDFAASLFDGLGQTGIMIRPGAGVERKFNIVVGQTIFTPSRYHDLVPDPHDRPFAGYLFAGGSLLQDTDGMMLENLELLAGIVGPGSLAKEAQQIFHSIAGFDNTNLDRSWRRQLRNEPGFALTYERKWRAWQTSLARIEAELIPEAGLTGGNVMTYAAAGATFRVGQNLAVDYGIPRIRPAPGASTWFDASRLSGDFGWYLFAGVQGRAVAHNIFLDGNTVANSPFVRKNILVGDVSAGVSVFWRDWVKLNVSVTERSKEFRTQRQTDHFGTVNLAFRF